MVFIFGIGIFNVGWGVGLWLPGRWVSVGGCWSVVAGSWVPVRG